MRESIWVRDVMCTCSHCSAQGPTYTAEWRHQTELRKIAAMPDREYRKHYLAGVRKARGDAAVKRIMDGLWQMHREAA